MTWCRQKQFRDFDAWLERLTGSGLFSSTFLLFCLGLFSALYLFGLSASRTSAFPLRVPLSRFSTEFVKNDSARCSMALPCCFNRLS